MGLPLTKPRRSEPWTEFSAIQVIKPLTTYCDELRLEEGLTGGPRSPRNTRREQQQGSSRRAGISSRRTCAGQANRTVICMPNSWRNGRLCSAGNDHWPILALLLAWGIGLGGPPNVPKLWQVRRYLRLTWTSRYPAPRLLFGKRCLLTFAILRKVVLAPVLGLAWFCDELLFGRVLDSTPVVAPLIEISAGRSGSTQLARYLEDDPRLVAPNLLQSLFPYLWLWKLAPYTPSEELSHRMPFVAGWSGSFQKSFWNGTRAIRFVQTRLTPRSTQPISIPSHSILVLRWSWKISGLPRSLRITAHSGKWSSFSCSTASQGKRL